MNGEHRRKQLDVSSFVEKVNISARTVQLRVGLGWVPLWSLVGYENWQAIDNLQSAGPQANDGSRFEHLRAEARAQILRAFNDGTLRDACAKQKQAEEIDEAAIVQRVQGASVEALGQQHGENLAPLGVRAEEWLLQSGVAGQNIVERLKLDAAASETTYYAWCFQAKKEMEELDSKAHVCIPNIKVIPLLVHMVGSSPWLLLSSTQKKSTWKTLMHRMPCWASARRLFLFKLIWCAVFATCGNPLVASIALQTSDTRGVLGCTGHFRSILAGSQC
jgi:hypothetical protein